MLETQEVARTDLNGVASFGGGGGGGGGGGTGRGTPGLPSQGAGWGQAMNQGLRGGANSLTRRGYSDPEGCIGRPTFDEGDAYSGDKTYGSCDGR